MEVLSGCGLRQLPLQRGLQALIALITSCFQSCSCGYMSRPLIDRAACKSRWLRPLLIARENFFNQPRKPRKLDPSKISRYTVSLLWGQAFYIWFGATLASFSKGTAANCTSKNGSNQHVIRFLTIPDVPSCAIG